MTDRHSLRHDLDGATPEQQAIHLALQREVEVDLTGYATQKWVKAQGYLTSVPESPSTPGEPIDIDLDGYATEEYVKTHVGDTSLVLSKNIQTVTMNLAEEANNRRRGDEDLRADIEELQAIEIPEPDLSGYATQEQLEGEATDRATGDEALAGQISDLQDGFDAAIIAGQEGAENINIELQSYLKKEDANTSFLKLGGGNMTGELTINRPAGNRALTVKKDGEWQLKIWADGTIETKKTGFTDVQFVTRGFTDSQYLKLTGGELTGNLINALYKTTRNTGYAFQCRPDNGDTSIFIHTSGHIEASGYIKVDGTKVSLENHTHSGYAASDHTHSGYAASDHTHSGYAASNHTHSDYATSSHNHDTKYVKGNWTISKSGGNWYIS